LGWVAVAARVADVRGLVGRCRFARYTEGVMTASAKEIIEAALKLDRKEREQIAHELLESIDNSSDAELSPAWEAEIQRRLEKIEAGEATFVSGDEVFARAEAVLRGER
jgi:putative addiction module component (TIGR02574 family)